MIIVKSLALGGATEEELTAVEDAVGASLPIGYRTFLAGSNGGRPDVVAFGFVAQGESSEAAIRYFLTSSDGVSNYSIGIFLERYRGRIPADTMPIACDSFGNLVLLGIRGQKRGAVYFWDHELEELVESGEENISWIAGSFEDFVDSLE